ncbi:MAG: hypothetical protein IPK60_17865 [Sandaracinaceae bacterium]|jgi:hypothetical protein|nr:hypothetical protein [Sandaracinaceae bacterium]
MQKALSAASFGLARAAVICALAAPAACSNEDPPGSMPVTCTSDGTPAGDCAKFNCEVQKASEVLCPGNTTLTFNCEGIDAFPETYQRNVQDYFDGCGPTLDTYMETEVETTQGTATISACEILSCAIIPNSRRMVGPMTIMAACAPVDVLCDFPDPPAP